LAPIPIASEAIGIGVAPVVAYVFFPSNSDRVSQPSTLAVAGLYTSTKTYGLGLAGNLNLNQDRYRFLFLIGAARARYEFFGIGALAGSAGQSIWLSQHGHAIFLQGLRRLGWHVFVGPRFSQRQVKADHETSLSDLPNLPQIPPIKDQLNLAITTAAFGFRVQRDTRNPANADGFIYQDSLSPALLYQTGAPDGTGYTPPNGGRPWGTSVGASLGNIHELRYPWRTARSEHVLDIPLPVPCDVLFFASVRQNDPALTPSLTDCCALGALSSEDQFLVAYSDFAQYGTIAGSLVFDENIGEDVP
jgi:hypothetical protein